MSSPKHRIRTSVLGMVGVVLMQAKHQPTDCRDVVLRRNLDGLSSRDFN